MKIDQRKTSILFLSLLIAFSLVIQFPATVFATQIDDNDGYKQTVKEDEEMNKNSGEIRDNNGTVNDNSGSITNNNGTVGGNSGSITNNNGTAGDNSGDITNNNGAMGDNSGHVGYNYGIMGDNSGSVGTNDGTMGDNSGTVTYNNGTMVDNSGEVRFNAGNMADNSGDVSYNNGTMGDNSGEVRYNKGDIEDNSGEITYNQGTVNDNSGSIADNSGTVEVNSGDIRDNYGTVETNSGRIDINRCNSVVRDNPGEIGKNHGNVVRNSGIISRNAQDGRIELNLGTVYNAGRILLNRGNVFYAGGTIDDDRGNHYFRVRLKPSRTLSDGTWSFNADSGFVSYRGFDCWLEKNGTGQMTIRLDPHSGCTFDLDALKKSKYFKARINKDGSLTIVVDRMYRWMTDVTLLIPLKKVAHQKNAASDGESASGSAKVTIKDSGESYEKATEFCTLTYDLDGGAFNNGTEYEETGMVERAIAIGEEITFDEIPAKDGYVFKYWEEVLPDDVVEDNGDEEEPPRYEEGDKYTVTGDVTFKAIWEKE